MVMLQYAIQRTQMALFLCTRPLGGGHLLIVPSPENLTVSASACLLQCHRVWKYAGVP